MIQPTYEIYTKGTDGRRAGLVRDWTAVQLVLRWNDESKFTLSGSGRNPCPFKRGTGIVIFRDGEAILSGLASSIESTYEADTEVWSWSVAGIDDIGLLARRVIYPDPTSADPSTGTAYTVTAKLETAVLGVIGLNAEEGKALSDRRVPNLVTAVSQGAGDTVTLTSAFDELLDFILTALSDSSLGIRESWQPKTGAFEISIVTAEDRSRSVVFSTDNGTLSGWKHRQEAPSANVVIVRGMETTAETTAETETATTDATADATAETSTETATETPKVYQWAVAQDAESVERWGRIEKYVERSDISTIKDEEAGTEETPEEVLARLQKAAAEELLEAEGKESWSLTVTPTDMTAWRSAWNLGDTVAFVADGEKLTAQIAEVKVAFSDAVETVTPTIGTIERGELGAIFDALGNLKRRIRVQENKK